jgi:ataxia telangiectasia mutated family protein
MIPFRLTRDIIDGFGMTGIEGVFRKCSEETLRVLREQSSVILTILDVLKYDPLQKWYGRSRFW